MLAAAQALAVLRVLLKYSPQQTIIAYYLSANAFIAPVPIFVKLK
jgi:hypothetical protein